MKKLPMGEVEYKSLAHIAGDLEFFTPFKGAELEQLLSHIQLYSFAPGETVFKKGGPPDAFYIIHEGRVTIRFNPRWIWFIRKVATLGPGNLFGEIALLERRPHSATAVTEEGAKLFVLLREDFESLLKRNPAFEKGVRWIASKRKFEDSH